MLRIAAAGRQKHVNCRSLPRELQETPNDARKALVEKASLLKSLHTKQHKWSFGHNFRLNNLTQNAWNEKIMTAPTPEPVHQKAYTLVAHYTIVLIRFFFWTWNDLFNYQWSTEKTQ